MKGITVPMAPGASPASKSSTRSVTIPSRNKGEILRDYRNRVLGVLFLHKFGTLASNFACPSY